MKFSLFDVICPSCHQQLVMTERGDSVCDRCAAVYLVRMGHLVPVVPPRSAAARAMGRSS